MQKWSLAVVAVVLVFLAAPAISSANKASVKIEAPQSAQKGADIVIKIHVHHNGNNFMHYVDWAFLTINGQTVQRWEFSAFHRPEAGDFTKEITYRVDGPLEIAGQANCNVHGSTGPETVTVAPVP